MATEDSTIHTKIKTLSDVQSAAITGLFDISALAMSGEAILKDPSEENAYIGVRMMRMISELAISPVEQLDIVPERQTETAA